MTTVFTCPWCGTNYLAFQTNCSNCGGPLLAAGASERSQDPPMPPAAPRTISQRYAWRLLSSDAPSIAAFILGILGVVFTAVGGGLTLGIVTAFVGIPFLLLGLGFLVVSGVLLAWRYRRARKIIAVLRDGTATRGQVTRAEAQYSVTVNGRHPWVIGYKFQVDGQQYEGRVTTLNQPGSEISPGAAVRILYLPDAPKWNSIYPHP